MGRRKGRCPLTPFRDCIGHTSMLLPRVDWGDARGVLPLDPFSRLRWALFHTSSACLSTGYPHVPLLPYWRQKAINIGKKSPCNPNDKPSRRCNNLETHPAHRRNASHQQYAADRRFRGGRAVESSRSDGSLGDCRSDGSADRDTRAGAANGTIGGCADRDPRSRKSDGRADRDTRSRKSDGRANRDTCSRKSDGCADRDTRP